MTITNTILLWLLSIVLQIANFILDKWFELIFLGCLYLIIKQLSIVIGALNQVSYKLDWLTEIWKLTNDSNDKIDELSVNLRRASKVNGIRRR